MSDYIVVADGKLEYSCLLGAFLCKSCLSFTAGEDEALLALCRKLLDALHHRLSTGVVLVGKALVEAYGGLLGIEHIDERHTEGYVGKVTGTAGDTHPGGAHALDHRLHDHPRPL